MRTSMEIAQTRDTDTHAARPDRAPWQRPTVSVLDAADSETGVNSTTDATATFS